VHLFDARLDATVTQRLRLVSMLSGVDVVLTSVSTMKLSDSVYVRPSGSGSGCVDLMRPMPGAYQPNFFFNEFFLKLKTYISLTGGSLGSWIDEERSKLR